ncbi:MAG TPA: hypothetical protein DCF33_14875 [Saprospirales bacterium]|nr:hypothetical protein [Saprospirales bacterium]
MVRIFLKKALKCPYPYCFNGKSGNGGWQKNIGMTVNDKLKSDIKEPKRKLASFLLYLYKF